MRFWVGLILLLSLTFAACQPKLDSPFSTEVATDARSHNHGVLSGLNKVTVFGPPAKIRIGILTDSHQDYDDLEPTIQKLNALDLDFVVHMGDFTNFGSNAEYDAFADLKEKSRHPTLVIIGNHDAIGIGHALYRKIFGDYNLSFIYKGRKFVLFNSNKLEFKRKDGYSFAWLENELTSATVDTYLFQHVEPTNTVHFTPEEVAATESLYRRSPRLKDVFHGHLHNTAEHRLGDVPLHGIERVKGVQYAILEIGPQGTFLYRCMGNDCSAISL